MIIDKAMQTIYFRDDFKLLLEPTRAGETMKIPCTDFCGTVYTSGTMSSDYVRFGRRNGEDIGFTTDERGLIVLAVDSHHLAPGKLVVSIVYYIPDAEYKDGTQATERTYQTDIELTLISGRRGEITEGIKIAIELPEMSENTAAASGPVTKKTVIRRAPVMRRGLLNIRDDSSDIYRATYDVNPENTDRGRYDGTVVKVRVPIDGRKVDIGKYFDEQPPVKDIVALHPNICEMRGDYEIGTACFMAVRINYEWPYVSISEVDYCHALSIECRSVSLGIIIDYEQRWVAKRGGKVSRSMSEEMLGQVSEPKLRNVTIEDLRKLLVVEYRKKQNGYTEPVGIIHEPENMDYYHFEIQRRRVKTFYGLSGRRRRHYWRRTMTGRFGRFGVIRARRRSLKGYVGEWSYYSYVMRNVGGGEAKVCICEI